MSDKCLATSPMGTSCALPSGHGGHHQSPPFRVGSSVGCDLWKDPKSEPQKRS